MSMDMFVDVMNCLGVTANDLLVDSVENEYTLYIDAVTHGISDCNVDELRIIAKLIDALLNALRE